MIKYAKFGGAVGVCCACMQEILFVNHVPKFGSYFVHLKSTTAPYASSLKVKIYIRQQLKVGFWFLYLTKDT